MINHQVFIVILFTLSLGQSDHRIQRPNFFWEDEDLDQQLKKLLFRLFEYYFYRIKNER
jgi:hypothetical protein